MCKVLPLKMCSLSFFLRQSNSIDDFAFHPRRLGKGSLEHECSYADLWPSPEAELENCDSFVDSSINAPEPADEKSKTRI